MNKLVLTPKDALLANAPGVTHVKHDESSWATVAAPTTVPMVAAHPSAIRGLTEALRNRGATVLVSGPPGSCKSTLLNCLLVIPGKAVVVDAATEGAKTVANSIHSVCRGETGVGLIVENADVTGVASASAAAVRKHQPCKGQCIVFIVQERFSAHGRTLASACGADVRVPAVPNERAVFAVAQACHKTGAALDICQIRACVRYAAGDLRKALIEAQWCTLDRDDASQVVTGEKKLERLPRDSLEAAERVASAGAADDLSSIVQGVDSELTMAYLADRAARNCARLGRAARVAEALSDDDVCGYAPEARLAALHAIRRATRAHCRGGAFPPLSAFGRNPRRSLALSRARALVSQDALDYYIHPVALCSAPLARVSPSAIPVEILNAIRRNKGKIPRYRAAVVQAMDPLQRELWRS